MEYFNIQSRLDGERIQEIFASGKDLRQFSNQVEQKLVDVEKKSIHNYIKESQNIVNLHNQIAACDDILRRMEDMLLNFQMDLGSISNEIVYLQKKSISMSQHLYNRQAIRGQLSQFIKDVTVPEELIMVILDCPVTNKDFLTQLNILHHKIIFINEQLEKDVKCCKDVADIIMKLKIKASSKIRSYFLEQISKFRKPMANYQIPQNTLLKYKSLLEFVIIHERIVANEICSEYVDTMSKIYFTYFKSYSTAIIKLMYEEQATKDDLMGIEEAFVIRSMFHKTSLKQKNTIFTIGKRGEILTSQLDAPIIIPHSASKSDNRYPYEALFRSEQYALVDNACREYLFITEFFIIKDQEAIHLFNSIMAKTMNYFTKNIELFINNCYDAIALFLCVQLVLRYQLLCHKRAVPALDSYWDTLQDIIWPRFETIFRMHIISVKECDPSKFNKEVKPHYITRRYAEFSAAIIGLSEDFPKEIVNRLLAQLLEEVELFILRMAAIFPQRVQQLVFLINNYDLALSILMERVKDGCKEIERLKDHIHNRGAEYVEEVLSPYFGGIMQYVKEGETFNSTEKLKKTEEAKILALVQSFSSSWKSSLESLSSEILSSFSNLVTGSSLLQLALTQLLHYYEEFYKLLNPTFRAQLVNVIHIKGELRKYKTTFS